MKNIDFLVNDPSTPDLREIVVIPDFLSPRIGLEVVGWDGDPNNLVEKQAANVYVALTNAIRATIDVAAKTTAPITRWPIGKPLQVVPRAGQQLNAYYNRRGLYYFYDLNTKTKEIIYSADSADVVVHEAGHALLDAQRPDFWNVQSLEIWAFHEAYADITAVVSMLLYRSARQHILNETGGDLRKSNVVSRLAEQMGRAIYDLTEGRGGYNPRYLRDATNGFNYVSPEQLPEDAPENKLSSECHSFGKVFLAAWYDTFVGFYEYFKAAHDPLVAIEKARDLAFTALVKAIRVAPRTVRYTNAISRAMLTMLQNQKEMHNIAREVFVRRNLVQEAEITALSVKDLNKMPGKKMKTTLRGTEIIRVSNPKTVKMFDLDVEIASDSYFEVGKKGITALVCTEDEAVAEAQRCVDFLNEKKAWSDTRNTMWRAEKGKLVREFVV